MGFYASLVVLYPKKYEGFHPECTIWKGEETVPFGYVTRLGKLTGEMGNTNDRWSPHSRAGICATSVVLGKLCERLMPFDQTLLAPEVVLPKKGKNLFDEFREIREGQRKDSFVDMHEKCKSRITRELLEDVQFLGHDNEKLQKHNEFLQGDRKKILKFVHERYNVVSDAPILWESSKAIVQWFTYAEKMFTAEWQELQKDPAAVAIFRAWRAYLHEVSAADTRVLFWFPFHSE